MSQAKRKNNSHWLGALANIMWPVLVGAAACSAFYVLVLQGPLHTPFMIRYFASHPILYVECGMFFVGLAALLMKFVDMTRQSSAFQRLQLDHGEDQDLVGYCETALSKLESLPRVQRRTYLVERLMSVFAYVQRKGDASGLEDELKYLADADAARQQEGYGLVRITAWATPMLGFLGTVVGITKALGGIDYKVFATDVGAAMQGLLAGLYVAFDTTALALVLSMILMFIMFFADRFESQVLAAVDDRVNDELSYYIHDQNRNAPEFVRAVERMGSAVIKTTETLIKQQTEQWKTAIEQTNQQLGAMAQATGEQIRTAFSDSLEASLKSHAERLARLESEADQQLRARWDQWHAALADNMRIVREQQAEVVKQTEILAKITEVTGDVVNLENSLNKNLQALMATRRFEDTVLNLSAVIQLLSARLTNLPDQAPPTELRNLTQGRAA